MQVEEGAEEGEVASPLASEATPSLTGGSGADLASMAAVVASGGPPPGAANGASFPRLRRRSSTGPSLSEQLLGGPCRGGAHTGRAARALRHHIRTAARRAPQYAAEGATASSALPRTRSCSCSRCLFPGHRMACPRAAM